EKIYDLDLLAVFHFAFAKVVKMRPPMFELLEVFRDPLREQDVIGIAAIHYPLRRIDTAPATLARPFTSTTPLTGPLCTPIRNRSSGCCSFNARLISSAHSTGSSGLW